MEGSFSVCSPAKGVSSSALGAGNYQQAIDINSPQQQCTWPRPWTMLQRGQFEEIYKHRLVT